jgi:hypothetical protein
MEAFVCVNQILTGDNDGSLITSLVVGSKMIVIAVSLNTPGCAKKCSARCESPHDDTSRALFEDTPEPPKVETSKLQEVDDETWVKDVVPPAH